MNTFLLIVLILIIIAVGLSSSYLFSINQTNPSYAFSKDPSICAQLPTNSVNGSASIDRCYFTVALNILNSNVCSQISDFAVKNICYADIYRTLAQMSDNSTVCLQIATNLESNICTSIVQKNLNLCPNGFTSFCSGAIAEYYQNSSLCGSNGSVFENLDDQNECIAIAQRNPQLCQPISYQVTKDECYYQIAQYQKDSTICAKISDTTIVAGLGISLKTECTSRITLNLPFITRDPDISSP